MIYSLVARENQVLVDYSEYQGNFSQVVLSEILPHVKMTRAFAEYSALNYNFFTLVKDNFVFLVMVDKSYETRIACNFLKQIQIIFYEKYPGDEKNKAFGHALTSFKPILKEWTQKFSNKIEADKLEKLKAELTELEKHTLENLDKILARGEKLQILVKKSEDLNYQTHDMLNFSEKVYRKMWWQNKKILVGIIVIIVIIVAVIALVLVI